MDTFIQATSTGCPLPIEIIQQWPSYLLTTFVQSMWIFPTMLLFHKISKGGMGKNKIKNNIDYLFGALNIH
jgi:hypothetical protein